MTKTDIAIYRGLKEKFDPEVHVGFFITTDTGELLLGDQSLGQTISGWEINDGVLKLTLNTGKDIRVTFPEATETVKGLLSAADKAQLNALQANLDSKVDKVTGKSLLADSEITKLAGLPNSTELTNSIANAKAAGDNAQSDLNAHKQNKSNPHEVTKAQVGLGNVTNDAQVKRSEMGIANGVATLDADGKVPATQLPSYVDDIIDVYATYSKSDTGVLSNVTLYLDAAHTQLVTGEAGKIYQNIADGEPQYQFRWTGTIFSQTGASSLILGEVTGTAYDGAKGKANADNIAKIKGTSLSHIKDAAPITTAADKVSLNYECFEGNQYGAAGTAHTADIPAATTAKAGVMSAADKTKLENLNSKLVVADEEDVTAVNGKIKFKDRDTTNGMGYKILRLPENGILTQDMINQANTIYEIRYNFDLNGDTITIPENCTLKFEGGKLSNGQLDGTLYFTGKYDNKIEVEFTANSRNITPNYKLYNSNYADTQISACYNNIVVMEDIEFTTVNSIGLNTSITGISKDVNVIFAENANIGFKPSADNITITNLTLTKSIKEELDGYPYRREVIRATDVSDIVISNCIINGAVTFYSEKHNNHNENIAIKDCIFDVDFSMIHFNNYTVKDLLTFIGYSNVVVDNNVINTKSVNRVIKTSSHTNDTFTQDYNECLNICITNNVINAIGEGGKQVYDAYIGSNNITFENNIINCEGFLVVFENKSLERTVSDNSFIKFLGNKVRSTCKLFYSSIKNILIYLCDNIIDITNALSDTSLIDIRDASNVEINFNNIRSNINTYSCIDTSSSSKINLTGNNINSGIIILAKEAFISNNIFNSLRDDYVLRAVKSDSVITLLDNIIKNASILLHVPNANIIKEAHVSESIEKIYYVEDKTETSVKKVINNTSGSNICWRNGWDYVILVPKMIPPSSIANYVLASTGSTSFSDGHLIYWNGTKWVNPAAEAVAWKIIR